RILTAHDHLRADAAAADRRGLAKTLLDLDGAHLDVADLLIAPDRTLRRAHRRLSGVRLAIQARAEVLALTPQDVCDLIWIISALAPHHARLTARGRVRGGERGVWHKVGLGHERDAPRWPPVAKSRDIGRHIILSGRHAISRPTPDPDAQPRQLRGHGRARDRVRDLIRLEQPVIISELMIGAPVAHDLKPHADR